MNMRCNRFCLLLILALIVASTSAQKFVEKPYTSWDREEALKLINDSAWAKPYQSTKGATDAAASQIAREQAQSVRGGGSDPRSVARDFGPPPVTFRLHSGLPLRQAIVRLQQIEVGYDKMNDADKAAFDQSKKTYLDCSICKDYYVITLVKAVDSTGRLADEGIFQGFTLDDLKGNVKLVNDLGEQRELVAFNAPKHSRDAAVFYFKRTDTTGRPLITSQSKDFKLVFSPDFLSTKNRFAYLLPNTVEFKVAKLLFGEALLF